jgi:hypothetical protein
MRASERVRTGDLGETMVGLAFQKLGWAPPVYFRQDIGDDLLTIARDESGVDLGLPVVIQVKSSPTAYAATDASEAGRAGWWYYEPDPEHFDHWTNHGLPTLLVLQDTAKEIGYWVHIQTASVEATGKGFKVFVPAGQRVDSGSIGGLLQVAMSGRVPIPLEGSIWTGLSSVAPGDQLRHAVLAPRVIAPHGNKMSSQVTAVQAVALIAGVRMTQCARLQANDKMPSFTDMQHSQHWTWRLAGALASLLMQDELEPLVETLKGARHPHEEVACRVLLACALQENRDDLSSALEYLEVPERASAGDKGWILAQRARVLTMQEEMNDASRAASDALVELAKHKPEGRRQPCRPSLLAPGPRVRRRRLPAGPPPSAPDPARTSGRRLGS